MATTGQVDIAAVNEFLKHMQFRHEYMTSLGPDLYHYTDLGGLQGIVEKHDLWLSNSQYCNDEQEMTYGYDVAAKVIRETKAAGAQSLTYLGKLEEFVQQREGVYICCFCEQDNLLSQWRSYAANGTGVSLKIDTGWFSNLTGPDCQVGLFRFWKVYYEQAKQEGIVREAIQLFAPGNALPAGQAEEDLARKAADAIQFFIPTFKNPYFFQEGEWRLIFTPSPGLTVPGFNVKFRVGRGLLVPYYSLSDLYKLASPPPAPPQLPIRAVRIGPSPYKLLNAQTARMLLTHSGYGAPVNVSDIPYRAL